MKQQKKENSASVLFEESIPFLNDFLTIKEQFLQLALVCSSFNSILRNGVKKIEIEASPFKKDIFNKLKTLKNLQHITLRKTCYQLPQSLFGQADAEEIMTKTFDQVSEIVIQEAKKLKQKESQCDICDNFDAFGAFSKQITTLKIYGLQCYDLQKLESFVVLEELVLENCLFGNENCIETITNLPFAKNLRVFNIQNAILIKDISNLEKMQNLEQLNIRGLFQLQKDDVNVLHQLKKLKIVEASGCGFHSILNDENENEDQFLPQDLPLQFCDNELKIPCFTWNTVQMPDDTECSVYDPTTSRTRWFPSYLPTDIKTKDEGETKEERETKEEEGEVELDDIFKTFVFQINLEDVPNGLQKLFKTSSGLLQFCDDDGDGDGSARIRIIPKTMFSQLRVHPMKADEDEDAIGHVIKSWNEHTTYYPDSLIDFVAMKFGIKTANQLLSKPKICFGDQFGGVGHPQQWSYENPDRDSLSECQVLFEANEEADTETILSMSIGDGGCGQIHNRSQLWPLGLEWQDPEWYPAGG